MKEYLEKLVKKSNQTGLYTYVLEPGNRKLQRLYYTKGGWRIVSKNTKYKKLESRTPIEGSLFPGFMAGYTK